VEIGRKSRFLEEHKEDIMTHDEVENILIYHNRRGFKNDLKLLWGRISDLKQNQTEISALNYSVAIPSNHNNASTVEVYVVRNATITEMQMEAKELERFIDKLDFSIDGLPQNEKSVILSRYFTRDGGVKEFKNVAMECNYSENWCETLNKKAIESINNSLMGYSIAWQSL
jgi:DNA-directed RNA polymerase specialized sigma subunit